MLAMADGAGSAACAAEAARFTVRRAPELVWQRIRRAGRKGKIRAKTWRHIARELCARLAAELQAEARNNGSPPAAWACTFSLIVLQGKTRGYSLQLGDGVCGYRTGAGEWRRLAAPAKSEYANETNFLHDFAAKPHDLRMHIFTQPTAALMATDGMERYLSYTGGADQRAEQAGQLFAPFCEDNRQALIAMQGLPPEEIEAALANMLQSGSEELTAEPDDKTLILAVLRPAQNSL